MTSMPIQSDARGQGRSTRHSLSDEVAAHVRELIVSGKVAGGDYLRMEPLAESLNVSMTPVREGLLALSNEGFVEQVPRRGFKVIPISATDIRDLFWAQAELAGELAARTARDASDAQIESLRSNIHSYQAVIESGNEDEFIRLGHDFHRQVNLATDSQRLTLVLASVVKQLPNSFYARIEGQTTTAHDDHTAIFRAIEERDPEGARTAMRTHLLHSADNLIKEIQPTVD